MVDPEKLRSPDLAISNEQLLEYWKQTTGSTDLPKCAVCGTQFWLRGDVIESMLRSGGGTVYLFLPVVCRNCGNTLFIQVDKILEKVPEPPGAPAEAPPSDE